MHLKSASNPSAEAGKDVSVTMFKFGKKRKCMATPENFDELIRVVKRKFELPTSSVPTFQACMAPDMVFDVEDSAYPLMKDFLDEIEVVMDVDATASHENEPAIDSERSAKAAVDKKGKGKAKETLTTPSSSPAQQTKPRVSVSSQVSQQKRPSTISLDVEPPSSTLPSSSPPSVQEPAPSGSKSQSRMNNDAQSLFDEDVSVEYASPKKTTAKPKPQVFDVDADEEATPTRGKKHATRSAISHSKSQSSEWEDIGSRPESPELDAETEVNKKKPSAKKPSSSKASSTKAVREEVPSSEPESSIVVKKEKLSDVKSGVELPSGSGSSRPPKKSHKRPEDETVAETQPTVIMTQDPSQGGSQNVPPASQPTEEIRFKICIYGPHDGQKAEFMTRSRHSVKKVLAGACKNFEIDPARARLEQIFELPDEDGTTTSHFYTCEETDTVHQAGIAAESVLRVVMIEDEEENHEANESF